MPAWLDFPGFMNKECFLPLVMYCCYEQTYPVTCWFWLLEVCGEGLLIVQSNSACDLS